MPRLGQQRSRVCGAGLGADESLEDLPRDAERLAVLRERGVQALRVGRRGEDEGAVDVAGRVRSVVVVTLAGDAACQQHRCDGGAGGERKASPAGAVEHGVPLCGMLLRMDRMPHRTRT